VLVTTQQGMVGMETGGGEGGKAIQPFIIDMIGTYNLYFLYVLANKTFKKQR
jgi:hypothetical protein